MRLLNSVSGDVLREEYNEDSRQDLFDTIREDYDGIELYTGRYASSETDGLIHIAEQEGVPVVSIHPEALEEIHEESGAKEARSVVNNYTLAYKDGVRVKKWFPDNLTFHPPQIEGRPSKDQWSRVVQNLDAADDDLQEYGNDNLVALENCADRDPRYMFTDVDDLYQMSEAAEENETDLNIVLDVGHATGHTYGDMVDIVSGSDSLNVSNIHVHDKVFSDEDLEQVREKYGIPEETEVGTEDNQGEVDHLPPGEGEVDFGELEPLVDDDTLVTVELHPHWTDHPEVFEETADYLRAEL